MILTTAGAPKEIIQRVAAETHKAVNSPDIKARFEVAWP
jgi:tripartite-type tricarboxylate transporter receptor subunit TctC